MLYNFKESFTNFIFNYKVIYCNCEFLHLYILYFSYFIFYLAAYFYITFLCFNSDIDLFFVITW